MKRNHTYKIRLQWTGNSGKGTIDYRSYERSHRIHFEGKPIIEGSSDPVFRGDSTKHNPEELFLSSLSACHMLWYLHLCADEGIIVVEYQDDPVAVLSENEDGSGWFSSVILYPRVKVSDINMIIRAQELHEQANKMCFIAGSCNFPVRHKYDCYC